MCTVTYATCRAHVRELGIWGCRHQGRRCPQTPHKRGTLGCDKGPEERAYAWGAMSPRSDGWARRRKKKGGDSVECFLFFLFFSRQLVRKEVWVEVPRGTKHPPVQLEVVLGVGR